MPITVKITCQKFALNRLSRKSKKIHNSLAYTRSAIHCRVSIKCTQSAMNRDLGHVINHSGVLRQEKRSGVSSQVIRGNA